MVVSTARATELLAHADMLFKFSYDYLDAHHACNIYVAPHASHDDVYILK